MHTAPHLPLHSEIHGEGPAVVLLHGICSSGRDWRKFIPALTRAGYQAITIDLLGHGDSAKPLDTRLYTTECAYAALEACIDALDLSEPFHLVGHSLGGYMSLRYALDHPQRLRKMVLINPLYSLAQLVAALDVLIGLDYVGVELLKRTPRWLVRSFISRSDLFTTKVDPPTRRIYAEDIKRASPYFLLIPATAPDLAPHLCAIPTPTLVIYGVEDHIERASTFPELVRGLPNGRGKAMQGCGHQPQHNRTEVVHGMMLEWIGR